MKLFAMFLGWVLPFMVLMLSMQGSNTASGALLDDNDANNTLSWNFHKAHGLLAATTKNLRQDR
jgi:hypothetical protein